MKLHGMAVTSPDGQAYKARLRGELDIRALNFRVTDPKKERERREEHRTSSDYEYIYVCVSTFGTGFPRQRSW